MLFLRYPEMKRSASCRILIQSSRRSIAHLSVKRIDMNESDPRSNVHCLGSSENKAWKKKIQARTGFEPMTSEIPVQRSTNWANKPNWELVNELGPNKHPNEWWF